MWDDFKKKAADTLTGKRPSIAGNIIRGNPWNLNLPRFKGLQTPLSSSAKIGTSPDIKMPKKLRDVTHIVNQKREMPRLSTPTPTMMPSPTPTAMPKVRERVEGAILGSQTENIPLPTPDPRKSWKNMADMVIREGNKRGYHGETLARQKALESAFGKSEYARERYNYGGVGAYDSNPDNAWRFESPEAYLNAYFDLIEKDKRYKNAYRNRANPRKYLEGLKEGGYASDPDYVDKILNTRVYDPNEE